MKHLNYRKSVKLIFSMCVLLTSFHLSGCIDLAVNDGKNKHASLKNKKVALNKGTVYTMRGGLGGVFSKGMNHLEDTLENDYNIHSSSTVWYKANALSDLIIKQYKAKQIQGPIILVGHSLGANEQIKVASSLGYAGVPVALLITIDAVSPKKVPPNVDQVVNIYKPSYVPMFSGLTVKVMDPKRTRIENVNVRKLKDAHVNHFTIDKDSNVQKIMVDNILATLKNANKETIS